MAEQRLTLHPAVRPALAAGSYELRTAQTVSGGSLGTRTVESRTHRVEVTAPRTSMDPGEVFGVFPPPHAQGPFEGRLPHITLRRRTLPWERSTSTGPPWLTVVVLAESEGTLLRQVPVMEAFSEGVAAGIAGLDPDERCDCLEVTETILDRVFPARDELDMLCHVREADASDTELADDDHWASVVLGNRLPQAGTAYRCLLVSLEGQHDRLPATGGSVETPTRDWGWEGILDGVLDVPVVERVIGAGFSVVGTSVTTHAATGAPPVAFGPGTAGGRTAATATARAAASAATATTVGSEGGFVRLDVDTDLLLTRLEDLGRVEARFRFPVLATWEFECSEIPGDFRGYMERLGVALVGDRSAADPRARPIVSTTTGHVEVGHVDRSGDGGTAWYRGPLVPVKVTREPAGAPYHVADQARRVGPEGREDLSGAAAFEVGRLLAMSDTTFLGALRRWARRDFAMQRDGALLEELVSRLPVELRELLAIGPDGGPDLGRLLTIEALRPGGLGGDPLDVLGDPLPLHEAATRVGPADVAVLAAGLDVSQATVANALGPDLADHPIDGGRLDPGSVVDLATVLQDVSVARDHLELTLADRFAEVQKIDELADQGELPGLLDGLFEMRRP
jgi:hypothetical protein